LLFASLTLVHGTKYRIAAGRHARGGQRFGQPSHACGQHGKQRRDGLNLPRDLAQFQGASHAPQYPRLVHGCNCLDKLPPAFGLTLEPAPANIKCMAHSFLVFDFGGNEDAAQQARHRIDGWKQGFRLDKKLQLKFDRKETEGKPTADSQISSTAAKGAAKGKTAKKKSKSDDGAKEPGSTPETPSEIHVIVRLDFSDHEKLSHQRWLERIPGEEPFKAASPKIVRAGDPEFEKISELFDSLD
jgi:hypothetical protein